MLLCVAVPKIGPSKNRTNRTSSTAYTMLLSAEGRFSSKVALYQLLVSYKFQIYPFNNVVHVHT